MIGHAVCSAGSPLGLLQALAAVDPLAMQPLLPQAIPALVQLLTSPATKDAARPVLASVVFSGLCGTPLFQLAERLTAAMLACLTHTATYNDECEVLEDLKV
jgi:hypothetical protein